MKRMAAIGFLVAVIGGVGIQADRAWAAAPTPAAAPEAPSLLALGVTAKVGTLGAGGDLTLGIGDYLSVRGNINGMSWSPSNGIDEGDIQSDLNWLT